MTTMVDEDIDISFFEEMDWHYAPPCEVELLTGLTKNSCDNEVKFVVTLQCCGLGMLFCEPDTNKLIAFKRELAKSGQGMSHTTGPKACNAEGIKVVIKAII